MDSPGWEVVYSTSSASDRKPYVPFIFQLGNAVGAACHLLQLRSVQDPYIPTLGADGSHTLNDVNFIGNPRTSDAKHEREELVGKRQISGP